MFIGRVYQTKLQFGHNTFLHQFICSINVCVCVFVFITSLLYISQLWLLLSRHIYSVGGIDNNQINHKARKY